LICSCPVVCWSSLISCILSNSVVVKACTTLRCVAEVSHWWLDASNITTMSTSSKLTSSLKFKGGCTSAFRKPMMMPIKDHSSKAITMPLFIMA